MQSPTCTLTITAKVPTMDVTLSTTNSTSPDVVLKSTAIPLLTSPFVSTVPSLLLEQKTSWPLRSNQQLQITEVFTLVKVEGTLDELKALFLESAVQEAKVVAKKAGKKAVKKAVKTVSRAPSAYNKNSHV